MTDERVKKIKLLNNIFFYISISFALYVLINTYIERSKLPAGVCPIENNNGLFYSAIGLLVLSFIVGVIIDIIYKKHKKTSRS